MELRWHIFTLYAVFCYYPASANEPPFLLKDMNKLALLESTPVGEVVYTLQGSDPEGGPVRYGLVGTDKFSVDPISGNVTLVKPLDRELEDSLKFLVSIEEDSQEPSRLSQQQPVTVIVLDENDNPPVFKNSPYEVDVPEDEEIGRTILQGIEVEDQDSVGLNLEVGCVPNAQWPEACDTFEVVTLQSSSDKYSGALVLRKPLNYNEKQFYQFQLYANDGTLNSTAHVEVKVVDVQNSPPVFSGALSGSVSEDAAVGALVLRVVARDADRARPRPVALTLVTNPLDFFILDSSTGELRTAKPLDREALDDPSSPLNITVRASEIVNGTPVISPLTSTTAVITISIKDVNDSPPKFNKKEYFAMLPESLPPGTPLPNLDIVVTDADMGRNSEFSLRLSDNMGAFVVEPSTAIGSASVTLRLNSSLDYEDPNQRKFILEIIAEELHTSPRLSSKASVTISLSDVNDNAPTFPGEPYSASVREDAAAGTRVAVVTASDRDTDRFGTQGIVYQLSGNGADLFRVDNRSGVITVAPCETPGVTPCLDYESRKDYFLQYKATDDDGFGQSSVVSLQISLLDANDNPPTFLTSVYKASIDEDAFKFEPELQVQARDIDVSSDIRYAITSPRAHPFWVDALSGKLAVKPESGGGISGDDVNRIVLTVLATDGVHNTTCKVEITVRDVNNHAPAFDTDKYDADISEDAPIGTEVAAVRATDLDSGINALIKYSIQMGAFDSFVIDNVTGVVSVSSKLDYDKRNMYRIQIVAADSGMPSQSGTTELTIHVINVNDKLPYFTPTLQRAEISADAEIGSVVHNLIAVDPDNEDRGLLRFDKSSERRVKAVDKNGKEVSDSGIFDSWFSVSPEGVVTVARRLQRRHVAVLTLPVTVTDTSAHEQTADGDLIITIVDVNRQAPVFSQPSYHERIVEELPIGTVLNTYSATDDTQISAILIQPVNPYFDIDNVTGVVTIAKRIDYESLHSLSFTLVAIDSGVPQLSSSASVLVDVLNTNDEEPTFDRSEYEATVVEHSALSTSVLLVNAVDKDEGEYGEVTYSLSGEQSSLFTIDRFTGVITVSGDIDRETISDIYLRAVATDNAPAHLRRSTSVPIHIKVTDINDNPPVFTQKVYKSTIDENVSLNPPAPILQVLAEDKDDGANGKVEYSIKEQSVPGTFTINPSTGIIYPAGPVSGDMSHQLTVLASDPQHTSEARVDINVLTVNEHAPVIVEPGEKFEARVPENDAQAGYLITTIRATDGDSGENGRVSYYLKVDNRNVAETPEFSLDRHTGELRAKTFLDREHRAEYELVIAAVDNGSPSPRQALRLLTVVLVDEDDNTPKFQHKEYAFNVMENLTPGIIIGTVKAIDKDSGDNGKVYYHILEGNQDGAFVLDRTQGIIRANISFDREIKASYSLTVYASNNPLLERFCANNCTEDESSAKVNINILDQNDNAPEFQKKVYYAGIKHTVRVNEPVLSIRAVDPDLGDNGTLIYMVAASNLYKFGASHSSGSVVPSPFNISQDGLITTAGYMSEYNQDRFVLDIIAQEAAPPHRQARTQVYVWVIDRSSLIRMIVSKSCSTAAGAVLERVSVASDTLLVGGKRVPLVQSGNTYSDWCEIHLHAVNPSSYEVLPVEKVLETIDSKYDELKEAYQQYGVETLIAASAASKAPDSFDPALAALIALLIVLFTGIVTFVVVCACLKHWVIPPPSMQSSKGDSLSRRRILEELSTTENPLWLETKLRPYEEQELTMNVFGDQQELNNAVEAAPTDNTYATIQGRGAAERLGDYATLGGDSPTPLEAALGFQGSTFKPPSPRTPEPPPRPAAPLSLI